MIQSEIFQILPQRPPFVMIDEVVSADIIHSTTLFTVREGHLFVENGAFREPGLVENMAQTAAAGTGYKAKQENRPAPVGFIGAVKKFRVLELPKVGETITTKTTFLQQIMSAHVVQAVVFVGEKEIASCELTIFLQSEPPNK